MKYLKLYALLALLLTAGGVTTHAQTEDDFWMEINPPTTGICSLIAYYITNEAIASDENLSHLALSLANKCDEKMENYYEAIAWYENVLTNPNTSFNDSIFAAIDLGDLYLRMEAGGEKAIGKYRQYMPRSAFEYEKQTEYALSLLPRNTIAEHNNNIELSPIIDLEVSVYNNDIVLLTWNKPNGSGSNPMVLSWLMNDTINDLVQAGFDSYMGNLYDTLDLRSFIGWKINSISFYKTSNWTHVIYVWEQKYGEEMHVLYSQLVPDEMPFGLTTIQLEEDLFIEPSTQYWFALRIMRDQNQQGNTYPFGTVLGEQGVEGKSNLYMDPHYLTWETIPLYNLHFWIRVCLIDAENDKRVISSSKENQPLSGYRIYRDGELVQEIPYSFVTYFTDTEFARGTDVEYCVTAVYGEEESESVCATATITGVGEAEAEDGVTVFPNPTYSLVRIEGATVAEVQVYNAIGQLVKTIQNSNEIDMGHLSDGVYLLRITATDGSLHTRKVTLNK